MANAPPLEEDPSAFTFSRVGVENPQDLRANFRKSVAEQRFQMLLVGAFSLLVFALGVVGTFGVASYGVSERRGELGIRVAFGATADDIRRLALGDGLR